MKYVKIEISLLVLFALLFAGCGGEREKTEPEGQLTREEALRSLRGLSPADGAFVTGDSIVVHWTTPVPSTGVVRYRRMGDRNWNIAEVPLETVHATPINGIRPGQSYEYFVSIDCIDGPVKSEVRSFSTAKGVSFTERHYQFIIERNYEQWRAIEVRNNDAVPHKLKATLKGHFNDLALGFVGEGSQDKIIELGAGESTALEFVIHAQDSKRRDYEFVIDVANADAALETPVGDSAMVLVHVETVNFHIEIEKGAVCPWTLSTKLKIINKGDTLTDFDIKTDPALAGKVRFHPQVQHEMFGTGQTMDVLAIPVLQPEIKALSGEIVFSAAGKDKRFPIAFTVPDGKAIYCATTHSITHAEGASSSCTNARHICDDLMILGNGPANPPPVPRPGPGEPDPGEEDSNGEDRKEGISPLDIFLGMNWDSEVADADLTFSDLRKDAIKDLYIGLSGLGTSSRTADAPAAGNKVTPKSWDGPDNPLHVNMGKLATVIKEIQMTGINSNLLDSCWSIHFDITKTLVGDFKQSWIRQKYMMDNQDKKLDIEMRTRDYNKTIDAINNTFRTLNNLLGDDDMKFLEFEGDVSPDDFPTPGTPYGLLDCVDSPMEPRYEYVEKEEMIYRRPWKGLRNAEDFRQIKKEFDKDDTLFDNKNYLDYLKDFIKKITGRTGVPKKINICPGIRGGAVRPEVAFLQRGLDSCNMREPFLLMGADNISALAWHSPMPGDQEIYFAKDIPGKELKVIRISKARGDSRWPYLIGNLKENLYIAWEDARDGSEMEIYLKRSEDGGENWSENIRLTEHGKGTYDPAIWVSEADAVIAWEDARGGIYRRLSSDSGRSWSKEARVVEGGASWPQFAGKGNNLWMTWEQREGENETVYLSRSRDSGKTWSAPFKVSGSSGSAGEPAIMVLSDLSVCVVWRDAREGSSEIYFRKTEDDKRWAKEIRLTDDSVYSEYPSLAETEKGLFVTFFSPSNGINFRYMMKSSDMGKNWSELFRIPALKPNVQKAYFTTNFNLPWNRGLYPKHDINIKINGRIIASFNDTVPAQGRYIFEFDPSLLNYNPGGVARNWIEYDTTRLRGGHFYVTSNHKIMLSHTYQEAMLVATSQDEADRVAPDLLPVLVNHARADIGIYANKVTGLPKRNAGPQKVNLQVEVLNVGAGEARDIEVYIAKDADGSGERLGSPVLIDSIPPMGAHTESFSFDYDGSCFMAAVIAQCKDADYDPENNRSVFKFGHSETGQLLVVTKNPCETIVFKQSSDKEVKRFASNESVDLRAGVYKVIVHGKEEIIRENVAIKEGEETVVLIGKPSTDVEGVDNAGVSDAEGKQLPGYGSIDLVADGWYDAELFDAEENKVHDLITWNAYVVPEGTYTLRVEGKEFKNIVVKANETTTVETGL